MEAQSRRCEVSWSKGMVAVTTGFWNAISIQNTTTPHSRTEPSKAIRVRYTQGTSNLSLHFSFDMNSQSRVDKKVSS